MVKQLIRTFDMKAKFENWWYEQYNYFGWDLNPRPNKYWDGKYGNDAVNANVAYSASRYSNTIRLAKQV